jgi:hypothetical protein
MVDLSTLPGCIGYYGRPSQGSACEVCEVRALCSKISREFIPKAELLPIYERVLKLEKILMGVTA